MNFGNKLSVVWLAIALTEPSVASILSQTGVLANPEDFFETTVTLASPDTLTLQTWGFGGGTNGAGNVIPAGGFDPLIAVFLGTGASATLVQGTSDILTNYPSFAGCPPAGTVTIGSVAGNCGDITLALSLPAGTYTILLSDAAYIPNAIFDNGTLGEGFTDLTGGSLPFQTCTDAINCIDDTANWALDISASSQGSVPEPAAWEIAGLGLLSLALVARLRSSVRNPVLKMKSKRKGVQI